MQSDSQSRNNLDLAKVNSNGDKLHTRIQAAPSDSLGRAASIRGGESAVMPLEIRVFGTSLRALRGAPAVKGVGGGLVGRMQDGRDGVAG